MRKFIILSQFMRKRAAKEKRQTLFFSPDPLGAGALHCSAVRESPDIWTHGHRVSVPSSDQKRRGWRAGTSLMSSRARGLTPSSQPWLTKTSTHLPQADFSTEQLDEKALRTLATVRRGLI